MNENKKRREKAKLIRRANWCIAMFLGATITLVITVNTNCTLNLVLGTSCIILIALLGMFTNAAQYNNIKLEPLPEPLDDAISSDHGNNLSMVMEALRYEPLEYRAIFNANGNKLAEGTLLSPAHCNVASVDSLKVKYAELDLHNHPGTDNLAFSGRDLKNLIANSTHNKRVVTMDYTYFVENPYWRGESDAEYPFSIAEFNDFIDKTFELPRFVWWLRDISDTFAKWHSIHLVHRIAHRFGLKFCIQNHRLEYIKSHLWTRQIQGSITRYAAVFGIAIMMLAPSTSSGYATSVIARNTQDIKVIPEQELVYDENYDYASEIEEKSSVADGKFQPIEPF